MSGPRRIRVAVIYGGRSSEHEISLMSGASVLAALDADRYDVVPVQIGRQGAWQLEASGELSLEPGAESRSLVPTSAGSPVPAEAGAIDVVLPVLHGPFGEDGTMQGLLEMLDMPYVGSGVLGSSLTMDKDAVKMVLRSAGIAVAESVAFRHRRWDAGSVEPLGYPCFVKPARLGSSVGISKVHGPDELGRRHGAGLLARFQGDRRGVHRRPRGRGGGAGQRRPGGQRARRDPDRQRLRVVRLLGQVRRGGHALDAPGRAGPGMAAELKQAARLAFEVCECAGMARIDFFVTPDDRVVLNEINAIPGFTSTSVYAKLFEASGISYPQLLDRLIELALERHAEESSYRH